MNHEAGLESIRRRAVRYSYDFTGTIRDATGIFKALTGIWNLHQYSTFASIGKGWGFCFHCKMPQDYESFLPLCNSVACRLAFNRRAHWAKAFYLRHLYPDALWLMHIDFSDYKPTHREYQ